MTRRFSPTDAAGLPATLAGWAQAQPGRRIAVDGPECAEPGNLAAAVCAELRALGHDAIHVRAETFWRDASLRLEYGRTDLESFRSGWLDIAALRREVLDPLGPGGDGTFLPSLRDPLTNRATREARRAAGPDAVLLLSGGLLLGHGLPFDRSVHLSVSSAARRRRTDAAWAWTLPAYDDYDREVDPVHRADLVVRLDDPARPAIG